MKRILSIDIIFPNQTPKQVDDSNNLFKSLSQLDNFEPKAKNSLVTTFKTNLAPKTTLIRSKKAGCPKVSFVTNDRFDKRWIAGDLEFGFNLQKEVKSPDRMSIGSKSIDWLPRFISTGKLLKKLSGKLVELNHAGINFSPKHLGSEDYEAFKATIAARANLYRYPTGEEWPFIIPAAQKEFVRDIKDESINRNPKFELVYSKYHDVPVIQFDIQTSLSKSAVFKLFPEPYGISFDGLENFFRAIFVDVEWGNILLRFDLGFKSSSQDFGYWLIKEGGRIRA